MLLDFGLVCVADGVLLLNCYLGGWLYFGWVFGFSCYFSVCRCFDLGFVAWVGVVRWVTLWFICGFVVCSILCLRFR